jgi:hypothetical protein
MAQEYLHLRPNVPGTLVVKVNTRGGWKAAAIIAADHPVIPLKGVEHLRVWKSAFAANHLYIPLVGVEYLRVWKSFHSFRRKPSLYTFSRSGIPICVWKPSSLVSQENMKYIFNMCSSFQVLGSWAVRRFRSKPSNKTFNIGVEYLPI